jgi:molybdopterin-guanine dinucleotide biosynthesis protein A
MAGQGARFGHKFKPFLTFGETTFIEAAVAPFRPFASKVTRFVFVYLEAQEREFAVERRLQAMFAGLPIQSVHLGAPTRGPAETIGRAVEQLGVEGPAMICDCDHALDVAPLFETFARGAGGDRNDRFAAVLPVWPLDGEDVASWSVALVESGRVLAIGEKRVPAAPPGTPPASPTTAMGVIGCYGFTDIAAVAARAAALAATNFSDVISAMLAEGGSVRAARIPHARFFGDPVRLEKASRGLS